MSCHLIAFSSQLSMNGQEHSSDSTSDFSMYNYCLDTTNELFRGSAENMGARVRTLVVGGHNR